MDLELSITIIAALIAANIVNQIVINPLLNMFLITGKSGTPSFNSADVNANKKVGDISGVRQVVKIDTSDLESLSNEEVSAITDNASHKIQLKQAD